jgi:hypothetical protein
MGIFRDRLPRDTGHPLDSDIDRALSVRKAHGRLDQDRPEPSKSKGNTAGPSSASASTPQKRGWRR